MNNAFHCDFSSRFQEEDVERYLEQASTIHVAMPVADEGEEPDFSAIEAKAESCWHDGIALRVYVGGFSDPRDQRAFEEVLDHYYNREMSTLDLLHLYDNAQYRFKNLYYARHAQWMKEIGFSLTGEKRDNDEHRYRKIRFEDVLYVLDNLEEDAVTVRRIDTPKPKESSMRTTKEQAYEFRLDRKKAKTEDESSSVMVCVFAEDPPSTARGYVTSDWIQRDYSDGLYYFDAFNNKDIVSFQGETAILQRVRLDIDLSYPREPGFVLALMR